MPPFVPTGKFHLHKRVAMSTMMSAPHHSSHIHPVIQAGGGEAKSEVPTNQLYLSTQILDHLKRLYDSLRGTEKTLSAKKIEEWLEQEQDQTFEVVEKEGGYKFEEFLEVVYYHNGFEAMKESNPKEKDLSKPISNYFISSSHNTYLSGNQLSSKSTTDAYKNVLLRGCRCIEIDVFNGDTDQKSETASISTTHTSPKPDHHRHLSATSVAQFAAEAKEMASEKIKMARQKMSSGNTEGLGIGGLAIEEHGKSTDSLAAGNSMGRPPSTRSIRNGEPLVLHGWTLTAPVGFRDVCKAVRDTAFQTSNLPIIVSLEVHANLEQQEVMVKIMKEEWKGLLVDLAHPECNPEQRLPRLDELLNKILIKVKKASPKPGEIPPPNNNLAPVPSHHDGDSGVSSASEDERTSKKKAKICDNLSNLGIYTHSEHFVSFEAKSAKKPSHIFSIGEKQIIELHETKRDQMFAHNRDYFMRAYPAGIFRMDSSNLDPSAFWRKGVQMVALNWQNLDEGVMLNEGMFAGEHGWVLKPRGYRSDPEPITDSTVKLQITIYGGQHIPIPQDQTKKDFNPVIKCELHVEKPEEKKKIEAIEGALKIKPGKWKHWTPPMKGDNPHYGVEGTTLEFPRVENIVEELSFVRFKIEDSQSFASDTLAAWACIRLDRLQPGYRFVRLLDAKGTLTTGMLLVKVEKTVA